MSESQILTTEKLNETLNRVAFVNTALNFNWRFCTKSVVVIDTTPGSENAPNDEFARRGWLVWAEFERPDALTGQIGIGHGRDEIIWEGTYESGVIKTAWVLVEMLIKHELMKGFQVDGCRPFNPHHAIEDLNKLSPASVDKSTKHSA